MKKSKSISEIFGVGLVFVMVGVIFGGLLATLVFTVPRNQTLTLAQDGETWYVDDNKLDCPDATFRTIQDAMNASSFGDIIIVCPGNYHEIDPIIEPGREVVIEEGAVWRVRSLVLLESAHLILRGTVYWQAGFSVSLPGEGASIHIEGGALTKTTIPFLIVDEAQTDKGIYSAYESVQITGVVSDQNGTGVSANVTAETQKPSGSIETISLNETEVSSYEGTFTDTSANGIYHVAIQAAMEGYTGHTVWLSFEVVEYQPQTEYELAISSTSGGSATTPGEGIFTYDEGTVVNLVATPDSNYSFDNWTGNISTIANVNNATTTITISDNYSVIANFAVATPCFIATVTYDTPIAEEIQILRDFRDEYLLTSPLGQRFVNLYYQVSPPIAEFITDHPSLKPIVRAGLVPVVAVSAVVVNTTATEKAVTLGVLVLLSAGVAIWVTRRRGRGQEYN
jgi:hypothetical protein